jgi:hypothetical protein
MILEHAQDCMEHELPSWSSDKDPVRSLEASTSTHPNRYS